MRGVQAICDDLRPTGLDAQHSMHRDERKHRRRDGGQDVHVTLALSRTAEGDGRLTSYVDVKQILNIFTREM
jgi:hypothetical protein